MFGGLRLYLYLASTWFGKGFGFFSRFLARVTGDEVMRLYEQKRGEEARLILVSNACGRVDEDILYSTREEERSQITRL